MDFAPYQSSPPEHGRAFSPPQDTTSPRTSFDIRNNPFAQQPGRVSHASPPPLQHPQPQRAWSGDGIRSPPDVSYQQGGGGGGFGVGVSDYFSGLGTRDGMVNEFDTTLGIRLDYEACLAYLALPPIGAILLLMLEHNSDYVRYATVPGDAGNACSFWMSRLATVPSPPLFFTCKGPRPTSVEQESRCFSWLCCV